MTDRGLPIVDGAPACPFVAFEDDRDGRALAPDHRHRCFAEPRPAPRALAHQEAYCLSSAFPVCPTFQDWARREAAAARPSASQARVPADDTPVSRPMPPLDRDARRSTDTPPPVPPRRSMQRNWAAPPPWSGEPGAPGAPGGPDPLGGAAGAAGLGGAAAIGGATGLSGATGGGVPTPPAEGRGLAGSAADRLAGPDPADAYAAAQRTTGRDDDGSGDGGGWSDRERFGSHGEAAGEDEPDWAPEGSSAAAPRDERAYAPPTPRQPQRLDRDDRPAVPNPRDQVRRREPQDASDLFGPAWERPQRYEAYPSLRTRVGLPSLAGIGRIGAAALVLLVAALALFFVGPSLLGIGGDGDTPGAGAGATSTPIVAPTPTPLPTAPPAPTPQVYVVASGDTISKIAAKFQITVEQLLGANPQITDPNKIGIGDQITIPVPVEGADGEVEGEPSPAP